MKNTFLSVIIPTYNSLGGALKLIDSLLIDRIDIEIIVVDDHSTDGTIDIIKQKYGSKVIAVEKNGSKDPAASRSQGFNMANGVFVVTMDSDDYVKPGYISNLWSIIRTKGDAIDHILTRVEVIKDSSKAEIDGDREKWLSRNENSSYIETAKQFKGICSKRYGGWSHIYKKEYLVRHKYDFIMGELALFSLQFNDDCASIYTTKSTYCYTINKNSLSHNIVKAVRYNNRDEKYCDPKFLMSLLPITSNKLKMELCNYFIFKSLIPFLLLRGASDESFQNTKSLLGAAAKKYRIRKVRFLCLNKFFSRRTKIAAPIYVFGFTRIAWIILRQKYLKALTV